MRARLATWMVRRVSHSIDHAYACYCMDLHYMESVWIFYGRQIQRVFFPLAKRLDKEAFTTALIDAGWWG